MKKFTMFLIYGCLSVLTVSAESPFVSTNGVGNRALGLANNYTAIAQDYSAAFWNPAGFAFLPVREVNIGIDGIKSSSDTKLSGSSTDYSKSQIHLSSAGVVRSLPTTKGGFAFAVGYSTPYSFNDLKKFSGKDFYMDSHSILVADNNNDTLRYGDSLQYDNYRYYASGNIGMWSAAAGWQVAQGLGFGITLSLLNGTQKWHKSILSHTKQGVFDDGTEISSTVNYNGFDIRFGGLYQVSSKLSVGARIELPQAIHYKQKISISGLSDDSSGNLKSSFSGAFGAATMLPFATISADVNFRSPNPDIDEGDLAYWKIGAGVGLEIPLQKANAIFRAGYSWKELDCYPYAEYRGSTLLPIDKSIQTNSVDNLQMLTCGITFALSGSFSIDGAYSYSHFSTETTDIDWKNALLEKYSTHRASATVSIKY